MHKAPIISTGNLFQDLVWAISRVQELDQENGRGKTPKLTNPTQLSDTPQEEALRLDVKEVSKNPLLKDIGKEEGTRVGHVDGSSGVLILPA